MIHIDDILGSNFIDKIFLMPTVLGMMFIAKYMIQYYQLDRNKVTAYILYSSNFALFIILLKFLFNDIDQGSPYGYIISDISLVFIAISVVYLVAPPTKNIEYEVLPQFIIYYALYLHVYGFDIQSSLLVLSGLVLFWLVIYVLCNYKELISKYYISYFFLSIFITLAAILVAFSQFAIPMSYVLGILGKVLAVLVIAKIAIHLISIIALMYSDLKKDAYIDALTDTYNRKKFEEVLKEILDSKNVPLFSIALFDVDSFKCINDSYGHLAGDYVLREISYGIKETLLQEHNNGQLFRYGGDEFFVLFRNQTGDKVKAIMDDIQKDIYKKDFIYNDTLLNVSISVGVSEIIEEKSLKDIIDKVDKNLYVAKANGKKSSLLYVKKSRNGVDMKKIMLVFGTRPEAIKMAPLVKAIEKDERFEAVTVVTAQHREMLDQVLDIFQIQPDYDLDIMGKNQTLSQITTRVIDAIDQVLVEEAPDIMLVHGDTSTTFAASIAAFYHKVRLGHVEAGLRTWDKYSPFPEEMNRQVTDVLSDIYFAPTEESRQNLLKENHPEQNIYVTGNTAIDALRYTVPAHLQKDRRQILVTMHRRENLGEPMENVFRAIKTISEQYVDFEVVYPLHKNPKVREIAYRILGDLPNVRLIEPLNVVDFHRMENESYLILTDSGGVQEEAPSFGVPVLVLRDTTERPEGVEVGALKLVGTDEADVYQAIRELLDNEEAYNKMSHSKNPYGDGHASEKILDAIDQHFKD